MRFACASYLAFAVLFIGGCMSPVRRSGVNKYRSARKFRKQVAHTKVANLRGPMRGGFRF